jgi:hypothetical protein
MVSYPRLFFRSSLVLVAVVARVGGVGFAPLGVGDAVAGGTGVGVSSALSVRGGLRPTGSLPTTAESAADSLATSPLRPDPALPLGPVAPGRVRLDIVLASRPPGQGMWLTEERFDLVVGRAANYWVGESRGQILGFDYSYADIKTITSNNICVSDSLPLRDDAEKVFRRKTGRNSRHPGAGGSSSSWCLVRISKPTVTCQDCPQ